jgi:general secretion pathway protein D
MVFLRPIILRDEAAGLKLTEQKYDYIRGKQQDFRDNGVPFVRDSESPVLPNFNEYLELPPSFEETQKGNK